MPLWSREPSAEAMRLVGAAIRSSFPPNASEAEIASLTERYGRGLAEELDRQIQQRRLQSPHTAPVPKGLSVLLAADPNQDFRAGSQQAEVSVPGRWFPVNTISEAQQVVADFIWAWDLGGGNWTGGKLARDGKVFAAISFNTRIWDVETGKEFVYDAQRLRTLSPDEIGAAITKAFAMGREPPIGGAVSIEAQTSANAKRGRQKKPASAAVGRKPPVPLSPPGQKINPDFAALIANEIDHLKPAARPDGLVESWTALDATDVEKLLKKAGKRKLGSVVEMIRRLRRERPDLDPALEVAIQKQGTLNERGDEIEIAPGVTMGLLEKPVVARILWAARYLNVLGEL